MEHLQSKEDIAQGSAEGAADPEDLAAQVVPPPPAPPTISQECVCSSPRMSSVLAPPENPRKEMGGHALIAASFQYPFLYFSSV